MATSNVDVTYRAAAVICAIEALACLANGIAVVVASSNSTGSVEGTAPFAELVIFAVFAALMGFLSKALFRGAQGARTPLFISQFFVLIVAFTLWSGDGMPVKIAAVIAALLGIGGATLGALSIIRETEPRV